MGIEMAEPRRASRLHSGAVALLVAVVSALAVAAGPAHAAEKQALLVPGAFRLEASNGYTLFVIAVSPYRKISGRVEVYAVTKGRGVIYRAPATVTDTSMHADLGDVGTISVTFRRSGRAVSVVCGDRELRFDAGSYEGTISFHGEEGFTSVDAATVPGSLDYVRAICGEDLIDIESGSGRTRGAELFVRNPALGQEMIVSKRRPDAAASISAWTREYTSGGIAIRRFAESRIPARDFIYDRRLHTATISPPAPFAGSARFDRGKKAGQRWSGNLTVDLPGRSDVPLTGGPLRAALVPGLW